MYHDLDAVRYIEYSDFIDFLKTLPMYSQHQCYYLLLGMTGFRNCEMIGLNSGQLFFDEPKPYILNHVRKPVKRYFDIKGRVIAVKHQKVKRREIPIWVRDYVLEYISRNRHRLVRSVDDHVFLFTGRNGNCLGMKSMIGNISWQRKRLVKLDPIKWGWMQQPVHPRYHKAKGVVDYILRFSTHAFRHSRMTWKAMEYLDAGFKDVDLLVSKWAGHSHKTTTRAYIESVISQPFSKPDLDKDVFSNNSLELNKNKMIANKILGNKELKALIISLINKEYNKLNLSPINQGNNF